MFLTAVGDEYACRRIPLRYNLGKPIHKKSTIEEKKVSITQGISSILANIETLETHPTDPSYGYYHAWAYSTLHQLYVDSQEIGLESTQDIPLILKKLHGFSLARRLSIGLEGLRSQNITKYLLGLESTLAEADTFNIENEILEWQIDTFPVDTYLARWKYNKCKVFREITDAEDITYGQEDPFRLVRPIKDNG